MISIHCWIPADPNRSARILPPIISINAAEAAAAQIKVVLMSNPVVVGVGNIYAAESLFRAGINPKRAANTIGKARIARLHGAIQDILCAAIAAGRSTINDFRQAGGENGYFQHQFQVYGRADQPCYVCQNTAAQHRANRPHHGVLPELSTTLIIYDNSKKTCDSFIIETQR